MVETDKAVLLTDPWFEGNAFYNGWTLLDQPFANQTVIDYLSTSRKKCFIWYSHEHSDHFSTSFLKELKSNGTECTILFQKTLDGRVVNYVRKLGFNAISVKNGERFSIEKDFAISVWSHGMGDSYCLIEVEGTSILNLNDCVVDTEARVQTVKNNTSTKVKSIDILLTQFGYANWVGNETDVSLRATAARDKLREILLQFSELNPKVLIPFASYVYFSHSSNFYLNDEQNSPENMRRSEELSSVQDFIFFLSPWQRVKLVPTEDLATQLSELSKIAESYWTERIRTRKISTYFANEYSLEIIQDSFRKYQQKVKKGFLFLPKFFEWSGRIKPIIVDIEDLKIQVRLSYVAGLQIVNKSSDSWDIRLTSDVLKFILDSDYGFNTTAINGRFRMKSLNLVEKIGLFFSPQEYLKNGYGLNHPFSSIRLVLSVFKQIVLKKIKD